jgi:hypothetical protein
MSKKLLFGPSLTRQGKKKFLGIAKSKANPIMSLKQSIIRRWDNTFLRNVLSLTRLKLSGFRH